MDTKRIISIIFAVAVVIIALIGAFVPEARVYSGEVVKLFLGAIPGLVL